MDGEPPFLSAEDLGRGARWQDRSSMNPKVDAYIARSTKWPEEMRLLRPILLSCGLAEDIKWCKPCYSATDRNIVIMQEMNEFLSLMFFKGALLAEPHNVLPEQGPNSRSARRMVFTTVDEVDRSGEVISSYVAEAISVEDRGLQVAAAPSLVLGEELQQRLGTDPALKAAFEALTPGRQREYNVVSDAKQASTRHARIDKYAAKIFAGRGMRE